MGRRGHGWTAEQEARLGKVPDGRLAKELGISLMAVFHRRRKLGIAPFGKRRQWTAEEEAMLGVLTDTEIAAKLGVSVQTVGYARADRGIPVAPRKDMVRRDRAEVAALVESCGGSMAEAAKAMGISRQRVQQILAGRVEESE